MVARRHERYELQNLSLSTRDTNTALPHASDAAITAAMRLLYLRTEEINPVESSFISIFMLLFTWLLFGTIILVAYTVEHYPLFQHADRSTFDPDNLLFVVFLFLVLAIQGVKLNNENRDIGQAQLTEQSNDGQETIASGLPTLPSRRSNRSGWSGRSGRSSGRSSTLSGEMQSTWHSAPHLSSRGSARTGSLHSQSTNGTIEDVDLQHNVRSGDRWQSTAIDRSDTSRREMDDFGESKLPPPTLRTADSRFNAGELDDGILSTHQTLEWRGLVSVCFLFYQLSNADASSSENSLFHNASRVGASSFAFISGYGHAMYYYTRNNYRFSRVIRVLFRLNITALLLCLAMERLYIFYYVCPLHSCVFLMTYGAMRAKQEVNYSKYGLRIKLLGMAMCLFSIWDLRFGIFDLVFNPFFPKEASHGMKPCAPLTEWYVHTHLHHWAVFVGIVYAVNYPVTCLMQNKTESSSGERVTMVKGSIAAALIAALTLWFLGPFATPRSIFDSTHSYFAFVPILSYVYFRNILYSLRRRHVELIKSVGVCSLEVFLFHHHFLLTNQGDAVLVLIPGYPKCNALVAGVLLFLVARTVNRLTMVLTAMMLPAQSESKCFRALLTMVACALAFYAVALALHMMRLLNGFTACIAVLTLGLMIYQTILDLTWNEYRNIGRQLADTNGEDEGLTAKGTPVLIGALVFFVIGLGFHILTLDGGPGSLPLPSSCAGYANEGFWAPVNACSAFQRGVDSRELNVGGYYRGCEEASHALHWGWKEGDASGICRFRPRTSDELQKKLSHRRVVFIGDVMVKSLFHGLSRALGDKTAGGYDASVAGHADIAKSIGTVRLEYKWSPLANDQVTKLRELRTKENAGQRSPDLIVVGGGTLDRLHVWATDEDQGSHRVAVQKLAKELHFTSAPTIWCSPTAINTPALGNDEKRNQMDEKAIAEVRKMYKELDIEESASFVLDGPSYTRSRVAESFNGVSYPTSIYDAGTQIMANTFDWLVASEEEPHIESFPNQRVPGSLSNPFLGLMMACFGMIGLFFFDGYFGFSYLSSLLLRHSTDKRQHVQSSLVVPTDLYEEAYLPYHQTLKLPNATQRTKISSKRGRTSSRTSNSLHDSDIVSLLDSNSLMGGNRVNRRK